MAYGAILGKSFNPLFVQITLTSSSWSDNAQTVSVSGILADETKQFIQPVPAIASQTAYYNSGILCTGQDSDSLFFTCKKVPSENLSVYVVIQNVGSVTSE